MKNQKIKINLGMIVFLEHHKINLKLLPSIKIVTKDRIPSSLLSPPITASLEVTPLANGKRINSINTKPMKNVYLFSLKLKIKI